MPTHALLFQYRALQHKHPIVNGFSGYTSPLVNLFTDSASPVVDLRQAGDFLRGLRSIGVRFVTVHPGQFRNRAFGKETLAALSGQADQIEDRYASETMTVLQLRPLDPPVRWGDDRLREIPFEEVAVSASHSEERLPMAFDGDSDTRWLTGIRQSGDEWIDLQFGRPRRVARVRFEIASRSQGDYPRRLRVELSPDGRQFDKVAWEDAVLPELLGGVVRSRGLLSVDIDLGGAPVSALRLRQTGETEVWFWSIDEMSLWELVAE
jgi:hypothetical protein